MTFREDAERFKQAVRRAKFENGPDPSQEEEEGEETTGEINFGPTRQAVTFTCDLGVLNRLDEWARRFGLTQEEAIRYIVGQFLPDYDIPKFTPFSAIGQVQSIEKETENYMKIATRILAATGGARCPECLDRLSSKDILEGKCSGCGKEF